MHRFLTRFLPPTLATLLTALTYSGLIFLIFLLWHTGRGEFRYLQI